MKTALPSRAYPPTESGGPAYDADTQGNFDDSTWRGSTGNTREQYARELGPLDLLIAEEEARAAGEEPDGSVHDNSIGFGSTMQGLRHEVQDSHEYTDHEPDLFDPIAPSLNHTESLVHKTGGVSSGESPSVEDLYTLEESWTERAPLSWDELDRRLTRDRHRGHRGGTKEVTPRQLAKLGARNNDTGDLE